MRCLQRVHSIIHKSFIVSPMSLIYMHVQLIPSIKCRMTMFTRILKCSRIVDALNMVLSVDLLRVSFPTDCAHKLCLSLLDNLCDILAKISYNERDCQSQKGVNNMLRGNIRRSSTWAQFMKFKWTAKCGMVCQCNVKTWRRQS